MIFGAKERGRPGDRPFDHTTGVGYVKPHHGHYHDALKVKQNTVFGLIADPLGGVTKFSECVLSRLAKKATSEGGRDGTTYGKHSTHSFYLHHAGAISMAIVKSAAETLVNGIDAEVAQMLRHA